MKAGEAGERAAKAIERAGDADERSRKLEASNMQLRKDLLATETRLAAEQVNLQKEQQITAKAQKDAADAQQQVNRAFATRILARQLKPDMVNDLKKLPAAKAEIQYLDDAEARFFARVIQDALKDSGWEIAKSPIAVPQSRFDGKGLPFWGITIFDDHHKGSLLFGSSSNPAVMAGLLSDSPTPSAADIRFAVLVIGIDAREFFTDETLPGNFFRIVVGPRNPAR